MVRVADGLRWLALTETPLALWAFSPLFKLRVYEFARPVAILGRSPARRVYDALLQMRRGKS